MAYSLSRYDQEVIINFNAEEDAATLYTVNPQWIRKLDRLVEQNPEQFEMYRQEKMDGRLTLFGGAEPSRRKKGGNANDDYIF